MLSILRDIRIQTVSPLPIRLIPLLRQPIGKQTPGRSITSTSQRLLKRGPRSGRIKRSESPRIQQSRLRLLPRLRTSLKQPPQSNVRSSNLPNSKLRLGHSQQKSRISSKRPISSRLIMLKRFLRLPGFEQCRPKPHPMLDSGRTIEINPRLAHCPIRIHELRNSPRSSPPAMRLPQTRQIDRKQINQATEQRKSKQQQQPVHILVSTHHVHGKEQRNNDVKTDSEK